MSLEIISRDLVSKAEAEREKYENKLNSEISQLKKKFEEDLSLLKSSEEKKFDSDVESFFQEIVGSTKTIAKKRLLEEKAKIVDLVKSEVLVSLKNMSDEEKKKFFKRILKKVSVEKFDFGFVYCNEKDKGLVKELVGSKIKILTIKDFYGLKFESKDQKVILDFSYEEILGDAFDRVESEILEVLF